MSNVITVLIGIGRNIGAEPMSLHDWELFQFVTKVAINAHNGKLVFHGTGPGTWGDVPEESAQFIAMVPEADTPDLARRLASLAALYKQEAIALTVLKDTQFLRD